jgi:hypothetical protein
MGLIRNEKGEAVRGRGADLTDLQNQFLELVREHGLQNQAKIAKELNYTSYYRDKNNYGTAFYRELRKVIDRTGEKVEVAKGMNLEVLMRIRDEALENGDTKTALEAIKIINDMQGYKAPTQVHQTKIDVKATIDLTAGVSDEQEYLDVEFDED